VLSCRLVSRADDPAPPPGAGPPGCKEVRHDDPR
jgi:hypothetical protein